MNAERIVLIAVFCSLFNSTGVHAEDRSAGIDGVPREYRELIFRESAFAWVPIKVSSALLREESQWDALAVNVNRNAAGAIVSYDIGLGQINTKYLDYFSREYNEGRRIDLTDPRENVRTSLRHLAKMYRATGDWRSAVASYNCGLTRFRSGIPLPQVTKNLTHRVFG